MAAKTKRASKPVAATAVTSRKFSPRSIAIMYRPGTPATVREATELAKWLLGRGFVVYCAPGQSLNVGKAGTCSSVSAKNLDKIDWVIVLGGDGTYLRAVQMLEGRQTPILGVNMGNLGFLTETRLDDVKEAIESTLNGKMQFRPRSMLKIEVRRKGKLLASHIALNDAVLERGSNTHLINIELFIKNDLVGQIKADALIVATPTGSTAYNLAAGGPILHPEARSIVVTPVCPHALTSRPLIFPDDQSLRLRVLTKSKRAILTVDGINKGEVTVDDEIIVLRNELEHFVIRRPTSNYFELLREKLKFGERN